MTTRNVLITGASRGIGAAAARLAARDGWNVAINYATNRAAAEAVAADVRAAGRRAVIIAADVGDPAQIERMFAACDAELGPLGGFVNNAGIFAPAARFVDIAPERLARTVGVNLTGNFLAAQHAARRLSTRTGGKGGAIVNLSSMAARLGGAFECVDYGVTKGAIDTLTVGMAKELAAEGVRVNGVRPGLIDTEIHASIGQPDRVERLKGTIPLGRGGSAQEVAETIVWLLSERSSYITGITVDVAGGRGI